MSANPNILRQVHQYVWYGTCEEELCDEEIFEEWGDKRNLVENNVNEISTYKEGVLHVYRPDGNIPSNTPELKSFECGKMYSVTLKKDGEIEMQNMYPSNNTSMTMKYGVSSTCSALGEIGLSCIPDGYTAFYYRDVLTVEDEDVDPSGENIDLEPIKRFDIKLREDDTGTRVVCTDEQGYSDEECKYYASFLWNRGGNRDPNAFFSIDLQQYKHIPSSNNDSLPVSVNLKVGTGDNERIIGYLTLPTLPNNPTKIHVYENGNCYEATIPDSATAVTEGQLNRTMTKIWSSSSMCTYSDPLNTETPVVFDAFEVGPDTELTTGNIQLQSFENSGDLKLPPADTSGENQDSVTINLRYYTDLGKVIGLVKYNKCKPNEDAPYVYFYARTGAFANTCLFGVIEGDNCILGE